MNVLPEAIFKLSDELNDPVDEYHLRVLSVAPLIVIPAPFAVTSVGVAVLEITRTCSVVLRVVELIVVVVPLTVKLPPTVTSPVVLIVPALESESPDIDVTVAPEAIDVVPIVGAL